MSRSLQTSLIEALEWAENPVTIVVHGDDTNTRLWRIAKALRPASNEWYAACRMIYERNTGLFLVAHKRWMKEAAPAEAMGFLWEGLLQAVADFDPNRGPPFCHWWLRKTRGTLQNWHRYQGQTGVVRVGERDYRKGVRFKYENAEHGTAEHEQAMCARCE